ncbi:hypothetical protein KP79_PYT05054 [Mizuhopecten yessoensis]|uniref:Death domain-containing protein n=1 Tax=Mizuhopecten yessoensis TaxID=6573 RepID=A0A210QKF4_MIZYE|nr:hypothetical protein KP79_PYT05054 [Mizuhopecten yessoensis]
MKTTVSCILLFVHLAAPTIDMNMKEMVYIANELSPNECKMLSEALHRKTFQLWDPVSGAGNPDDTCLNILLRWDSTEGKGKTFNTLALRLSQIGRSDVADKISKEIYHEEAEAIHKNFLDDPFRSMIVTNSILLDDDQPSETVVKSNVKDNSLTTTGVMMIFIGATSFFILLAVSFRKCCPGCFCRTWRRLAPDTMVEVCNLCCGELRVCCVELGSDYRQFVVGAKPREEDVLTLLPDIEQSESVTVQHNAL